jgi:hypothetical protein
VNLPVRIQENTDSFNFVKSYGSNRIAQISSLLEGHYLTESIYTINAHLPDREPFHRSGIIVDAAQIPVPP